MNRLFLILLFGLLAIQCRTERVNLDGHYVSVGQQGNETYLTLDIFDSLILINKDLVFAEDRDTLIINPLTNSFKRATRVMFPFFDFKVSKDTVILYFTHDAGDDRIKFIKANKSNNDYFSTSLIDIELGKYKDERQVEVNDVKVKNLTIGTFKKERHWSIPDSVYVIFENVIFLVKTDFDKFEPELKRESLNWMFICLNFDRRLSDSICNSLRLELIRSVDRKRLIETRMMGDKLVYIEIATANN